MVEGLGSAVLPQPYQQQAMPTPRRRPAARCAAASASARAPVRAQRLEAVADADGAASALAGGGGVAVAEGVRSAELQPVEAGGVGEAGRPGASVAMAACGTPKPRKAPATGSWVWMARARASDVRHAVGAGGVHRHAVRDGRAPARVGAGVEDALEVERGQPARRRRSRARAAIRAGWRLVVAAIDSGRGRRSCAPGGRSASAARPRSGCTERSSLPPKPPPTAEGTMRTPLGRQAEDARRCRRGP